MVMKRWAAVLTTALLLAGGWFLLRPCLFIKTPAGLLAVIPAMPGMEFSTRFIHSVQKTPVEEFFAVNEGRNGFILRMTRYQSFGVGLPFLAEEGTFREDGNFFVVEDMKRRFSRLDFRPGVKTELTLTVGGEVYRLYELVPPGALVSVYIAPYYRRWQDSR